MLRIQGTVICDRSWCGDKSYQPNAENLNFAVSAQALLKESDWEFAKNGKEYLQEYLKKLAEQKATKE